jgi:simple sugar transport system permease protein
MNWNEVIGSSALVPLFSSGVALAVPTATAAVGECFSERAGNLNLGVEGMMLTGAYAGFIGTYYTHSVAVGVLCGIGAGILLGIVMAGLSIWLKTEQVINGIALVLFAQGLTAFLYGKLFSTNNTPTISTPGNLHVPLLADIPVIGHVLFRQNSLFYIAVAAMLGVIFVLYRTRFGLSVRATGEDPAAADAAAIPVDRVRWIALLVGGATAGLGGAVLAVGQLGIIQTNVTAGAGWIAVALVIFGRWNPVYVILGAFLFGTTDALQLRIQAASGGVTSGFPYEFFQALPYLVTLAVMVAVAIGARRTAQPAALGAPFRKEVAG